MPNFMAARVKARPYKFKANELALIDSVAQHVRKLRGFSRPPGAVAQVSQPAVSQCFQTANRANIPVRRVFPTSCRLEIGDTAGWETCATSSCGFVAR